MQRNVILAVLLALAIVAVVLAGNTGTDPRLKAAFRKPEQNGWIQVHLEGSPSAMGYQHGCLLAAEIDEAKKVIELELTHDTQKPWSFFRDAARSALWPKIESEYRQELEGIVAGLREKQVSMDLWDVVALNAWLEFNPYYVQWHDRHHPQQTPSPLSSPAERCSAFVATGTYTRDGRIVIGHNAWTNYLDGQRWRIVFDIAPVKGHRILMDGFPGLIHSADDFGVNSAGILITETTISQFFGWNPQGIPEFVRARKAMQYASSIDDFARLMKEGNNGGYANNWLVADVKTNEIASLELGLKNVNLRRTRDGYFAGSNFPVNEKLVREETRFSTEDLSVSANARRLRWDQLMAENRGRIDIAAAQRFLSDHYDTFTKSTDPSERTLCGHIDLSPRGAKDWQPPFGPAGAAQNKVSDATMAERLSFAAAVGHACGLAFKADEHLRRHPEFSWQKPFLNELTPHPWTDFSASD